MKLIKETQEIVKRLPNKNKAFYYYEGVITTLANLELISADEYETLLAEMRTELQIEGHLLNK